MASIIRIKRSETAGNPSVLAAGELAYSGLADNGANGGDRLYIGMGTETSGNAANHVVVGGKYYTGLIDAGGAGGTLTTNAKSIPVLSATGTIDQWLVGNLKLSANTLISTNTNGDINITPNGTGKTVISNLYIGDTATTLQEYIYDQVGGTITQGTGINVAVSDAANTTTISLTNTGVTAGSYGSSTAIPVVTVDAQGRITSASTTSISTTITLAATNGTGSVSGGGTLSIVNGVGIATSVTGSTYTIDVDSTVARLDSTQTLTNKTISLSSNTLTGTSAQLAAAITDETGSGSLVFATSPTLVTPTLGDAKATSITGTTTTITINAAAGNNNVILAPTGTGTVDVSSKRISNLATPVNSTDAATKAYVDATKSGLDIKDSVRATTIANITLSGTQTIDGVTLVAGDRVLVKDQTTGSQNGIYVVAAGAWTRATDFDNTPGVEVTPGAFTFVEEGTSYADTGWVLTNNGTITIDSTALTFTQFSGAGQIVAGAGLTKSGNTIDVGGTANRITVNADNIDIALTYAGQTSINTLGTVTTGQWQATLIDPQFGGTGVNNAGKSITLGGNFVTSGAFAITLTATATTNVTLPTTGTLATLAGTETFTNKTLTSPTINGGALSGTFSGNHTLSGITTLSNTTDASNTTTAGVVISGGLAVAKKIYVGSNIVGAGAATSTLDGFTIDGGTY